jgi:hypothetical protein
MKYRYEPPIWPDNHWEAMLPEFGTEYTVTILWILDRGKTTDLWNYAIDKRTLPDLKSALAVFDGMIEFAEANAGPVEDLGGKGPIHLMHFLPLQQNISGGKAKVVQVKVVADHLRAAQINAHETTLKQYAMQIIGTGAWSSYQAGLAQVLPDYKALPKKPTQKQTKGNARTSSA